MLVAISGASGLIGTALSAELTSAGHEVVRLVRREAASAGEIRWDPLSGRDSGALSGALTGVDAVVHLSGAPIAAKRWTPSRKAELRSSRITSTRTLVTAMAAATPPPGVLICGSATGYYGDTGGKVVDESGPAGVGFLPDLVRDWEAAAEPAAAAGI